MSYSYDHSQTPLIDYTSIIKYFLWFVNNHQFSGFVKITIKVQIEISTTRLENHYVTMQSLKNLCLKLQQNFSSLFSNPMICWGLRYITIFIIINIFYCFFFIFGSINNLITFVLFFNAIQYT